jgi:hypothetical protein
MTPSFGRQALFSVNATLLLTHQIDAAYWQEWSLFHLPGGNQLNLILNLPIVAGVLYAQARVAQGGPETPMFTRGIGFLGFLTVAIHSGFFLAGHHAFVQPMSLALLVGTFAVSGLLFITRADETARAGPLTARG